MSYSEANLELTLLFVEGVLDLQLSARYLQHLYHLIAGNTCDEVEEWVLQEKLSVETLNVLKKHGFTSMEKVRHLKSVDVKNEFGDELLLAERLALREAIGRLPKASQRRHHGLLTITELILLDVYRYRIDIICIGGWRACVTCIRGYIA